MAKGDIFRPDLFSKHTDNGDGTITATLGCAPLNYLETDGSYQECDLNILTEKNWEFEYAVKKNTFNAYFNDSTDINNFTLAGFEILNSMNVARWINYKLFNANPTGTVVNGKKIKYTEVFPNIDLEYDVNTSFLKENIIVKAPVTDFGFTFSLKLDGVKLVQQTDNSIDFVDVDTNEIIWRINSPYAYDSNSDLKKVLYTKNISYTLGTVVYDGVEYQSITATLNDKSFLENAVYPIIIDPTTSNMLPAYGNTLDASYSYNSAYKSSIGSSDFVLSDDGSSDSSAVIHFAGLSAYGSYNVTSVSYTHYTDGYNSSTDNGIYECALVFIIGDWTNAGVSYSTLPPTTMQPNYFNITDHGELVYSQVINVTNSWKNGTASYGVIIQPLWSDSGKYMSIQSPYSGQPPYINITYTAGYGHKVFGVASLSKVEGILPSKVCGI